MFIICFIFSLISNMWTCLQQCFSLVYKGQSDASNIPKLFPVLLDHLGSSIVEQFFMPAKGQITWIEFVRSYNKCSARMSASMSLNMLLRVFHSAFGRANAPVKLELEFDADPHVCL